MIERTAARVAAALLVLVPFAHGQETPPTSEPSAPGAGAFAVHLSKNVFAEPFSGQLFVAFGNARSRSEPRRAMHGWVGAPPLLRFDVEGVAPDTVLTLRVADAAAHHPVDWSEVAPQEWKVQAIARRSLTGREAGLDAGDVYGEPVAITWSPGGDGVVRLELDTVAEERPFEETDRMKSFEFTSPALSKFHGFDYVMRAGVLLPIDWKEGETYPVVYSVTGFGGTAEGIRGFARRRGEPGVLDRCIVVVPDASNRWGHSVFCNSRSIGPWGDALVKELIPALEKRYGGAGAEQRYVTGVSSGGWSSLWLQVAYPDAFAGCWSHVPDPIDFHDFQQIDLYDPLPDGSPRNMYRDEQGAPRPLMRQGEQVVLTYEDFVRRENVTNPGGQIRSFEATFSPLGPDGTPRRVFDVATGAIDSEVAKTWEPYDISNLLLTRWDELEPRLDGKIHVYAGGLDTFYLEGAVERFRALAEPRGLLEHMTIEVVPGMPHQLYGPGNDDMLRTIEAKLPALVGAEGH
ncbi:MAG: alpha/beta hydrolase-fold protein [Planctomycetota bacterium]